MRNAIDKEKPNFINAERKMESLIDGQYKFLCKTELNKAMPIKDTAKPYQDSHPFHYIKSNW